ncbi:MAG: aminotransferase class I/II-fold pyridoxal phosphate-dependent enzyme [Mariprofundales bacterium]
MSQAIYNARLHSLTDYPFTRLRQLLANITPPKDISPMRVAAGEPRTPQPAFVQEVLMQNLDGFGRYPPTQGCNHLRKSIAKWLHTRYGVQVNHDTQVLTANGTREALFSVAHAFINPDLSANKRQYVLMPNPMYQIYYGAAITAGAKPYLLSCTAKQGFAPDLSAVPDHVWQNTALIYVCSPSNPTGWVADTSYYKQLLKLADIYDFVICADECYSEIYTSKPPCGLLQVAASMGNTDFDHCLVFNSLSKRSGLPGLRSGLIAGSAKLITIFAKLRNYAGAATPLPLQAVAAAAWDDEKHVVRNRLQYRQSSQAFCDVYGCELAAGGFFIWLPVSNDEIFAKQAFAEQNITLIPGSYLAASDAYGNNPARGFVRVALIDTAVQTKSLAQRLLALRTS